MSTYTLIQAGVDEDDAYMEHLETFDSLKSALAGLHRAADAYGKEIGEEGEGYGSDLIMVGHAGERVTFEVFKV